MARRARWRRWSILFVLAGAFALVAMGRGPVRRLLFRPEAITSSHGSAVKLSPFQARLVADLDRQVRANIRYHDAYYAGGEPPANEGVCTDVVIRALRAGGVDLQAAVADDVSTRPSAYRIERPDANIDHRRCRNLIVFFRRHSQQLPADRDWQPGDIVLWSTASDDRVDHIGMVGAHRVQSGDLSVVHHWPGCPVRETADLHAFQIIGHFRWSPTPPASAHPSTRARRAWQATAQQHLLAG